MLLLASGSPRRHEIMTALGLAFEVRTPRDDAEPARAVGEAPGDYALRAARAKAAAVAAGAGADDWVIAADTVVAVADEVLGKPVDPADARRMIAALAGRTHEVITAFTLWRGGAERHAEQVVTRVTFAALSAERVRRYCEGGEGRDKAGAYAIQGAGMTLVRAIEGSYSNVVGLPAAELRDALERLGALG